MWINLSSGDKGLEPEYQQVDIYEMPVREIKGSRITTIVGKDSPLRLHTEVEYCDVSLEVGATLRETMPSGYRGLIYVVSGSVAYNGNGVDEGQAAFGDEPGDLVIEAWENCRLMLCFGKPHGEPIHPPGKGRPTE